MKLGFYGVLQFLIPVAIFAAIFHDGLTMQTAHHSGTQSSTQINHK
jgi:branched-subunit amino acid transport protein